MAGYNKWLQIKFAIPVHKDTPQSGSILWGGVNSEELLGVTLYVGYARDIRFSCEN
jgi:transcription termination factor Rho